METFTVEPGTYQVKATYHEFSEIKTVTVKAGDTKTVEFRWYTKPAPSVLPLLVLGGLIVLASARREKE
jgi:hypothetical protein